MSEKKDNTQPDVQPQLEEAIDFARIGRCLKKHKKLYGKVLLASIIFGLIVAFSIPNTFKCEVSLAPELGANNGMNLGSLGSLGSLASSMGLDISAAGKMGDAITPILYPDLMNSVDFKAALFNVKVQRKEDKEPMSYYDYLKKERSEPWWESAVKMIMPEPEDKDTVDPFELTMAQEEIAKIVSENVTCEIDKKTGVIKIVVKDQDARVSAVMADSVKERLQDFLTMYRTKKARHDLAYVEGLCRDAKKDYERVRQKYVEFMDANQDLVLQSVRQKQTDLENDMQLYFNNYNSLCSEVLSAKAKVLEVTPAFTTLQSATIPLRKSSPKRSIIMIVVLALSIFFTTVYILYDEDELKYVLGLPDKKKEKTK